MTKDIAIERIRIVAMASQLKNLFHFQKFHRSNLGDFEWLCTRTPPGYFTPGEAAYILGISHSEVVRLATAYRIRCKSSRHGIFNDGKGFRCPSIYHDVPDRLNFVNGFLLLWPRPDWKEHRSGRRHYISDIDLVSYIVSQVPRENELPDLPEFVGVPNDLPDAETKARTGHLRRYRRSKLDPQPVSA